MTAAPTDSTTPTRSTTAPDPGPGTLRRLHLARAAFALAWAALFALTSSPFGTAALVLAVLYPTVDLAAAAADARSASAGRTPKPVLYVNMVVSAFAALALVAVGTDDVGDVLLVWGAWAVASGAVQLVLAVQRRAQPGQYPLILSGALSVVAGGSFAASAPDATSPTSIAGYAALGGVFFLVSGLRAGRRLR